MAAAADGDERPVAGHPVDARGQLVERYVDGPADVAGPPLVVLPDVHHDGLSLRSRSIACSGSTLGMSA